MSVYALDDCFASFNGQQLSGFGEGGAVNINLESDLWENTKMVDGHVSSSKIHDESAMIEVVTRWNSQANAILEDEARNRTTGAVVIRLPDDTEYHGDEARIQRRPSPQVGQKHGDNTWVIFVETLEMDFSSGEA